MLGKDRLVSEEVDFERTDDDGAEQRGKVTAVLLEILKNIGVEALTLAAV